MKISTTKDIIIDVPLVDQHRDTEDKNWASRACGICAIKMLMAFYNKKNLDLSVMRLVREAIELGGFIENIGWRHDALVSVAERYGAPLNFKKKFPKSLTEKKKDLKFIEGNILKNKPVIASIFHRLDHSRGGHLIVIHGIKKDGKKIEGYFIQDPDSNFRGNNYYVTKEEFINNWRGGFIWFND